MPKRKGSSSSIKTSPGGQKNLQKQKFKQKVSGPTWQCKVCSNLNSNQNTYCLQCYHSLYYYFYVNMHMFVANDNQFEKIFYRIQPPVHSKIKENDEQTGQSSAGESEEEEYVDINWVQNILSQE